MKNQIFHSGVRLRVLRELKGLKEKELAEALSCKFDTILLWESKGVPGSKLKALLDFFEVSENLFSAEVISEEMLNKFAISELQRPELENELHARLTLFCQENSGTLDLSSLGLSKIPDSVFSLPNFSKIDLSDNLLSEIPRKLQILIDSGCKTIIRNNFIDPSLPDVYNMEDENAVETLVNNDFFIDNIRLLELRLENIGIYEDLTINFNDKLTVLIGVNGAGKTTILKAVSLAILGVRDSVKAKAILLRSVDTPRITDSKITLKATVNNIVYSNEITLSYDSDTGEIEALGKPFEVLYKGSSVLKNLILCLGEQRNNSRISEKQDLDKHPRVLDLLPLLRGDDQSCMKNFTAWWANLEASKINEPNAQNTINLCFDIFSKFMDENIQSAGLKKVKPDTELWLRYASGKSVPFYLASQGYQAVMGWVGFIIQRMIESNEMHPLPLSQPSIVIIDEIDQLLSIKWQQKVLSILREFFPNTQWIISTHSPMVLTDLNRHQVIQLHERDGNVVAESNEVDLWMWQYGDIIRRYFEITTTPPKYQEELLNNQISSLVQLNKTSANILEIKKLNERLKKVKASAAAADKFEKQLQSLKDREEQLITLMDKLKSENC